MLHYSVRIFIDDSSAMSMRQKLTVIIPTYNVENLIEPALNSVTWADEIFVVDSFSTDDTLRIAKRHGARIIRHEYVYSAKQKNWAIPRATNSWILLLDSDEVVTRELRNTIKRLLASPEIEKYDGFSIARKHFFLGKFLRWGGRYPLYNIRLFRQSCRYEDRDVHAHIILPKERTKTIVGDILHYSDRSLSQFFEKFNRYSTWHANYMFKVYQRHHHQINWKEAFTNVYYAKALIKDLWTFLPFTPLIRFLYMYVIRLGFLDGRYGFLIALFYSFQDYVAKTKYLEMRREAPLRRLFFQKRLMRYLSGIKEAQRDDTFSQTYNHNLSISQK